MPSKKRKSAKYLDPTLVICGMWGFTLFATLLILGSSVYSWTVVAVELAGLWISYRVLTKK